MSFLHWNTESVRIKAFSSAGKGSTTVVKIELVTDNPVEAGFIMSSLAETQTEQRRPGPAPRPSPRSTPTRRELAAPAMLALPAPGSVSDV